MNAIQLLTDKILAHNNWQETKTLARNEYLKVRGSIDTNIYYVVSGSLRIF